MNECAHAWITVTLPMLFVGPDVFGIPAESNKSSAYRRMRLYRALKVASV